MKIDDEYEKDREVAEELFEFLKGNCPDGTTVDETHQPKLTPDQAWTVIWFIGNQHWAIKDHIERCEVCGKIYNSWCEGDTLDYGESPYRFCGSCRDNSEEYATKSASPENPDKEPSE